MFLSLQLFLFLKSVMDTTNGWQFGKPLPDRINYMLQKQLMCDVTFLVGAIETPIKTGFWIRIMGKCTTTGYYPTDW
jgi:hypothetical protein